MQAKNEAGEEDANAESYNDTITEILCTRGNDVSLIFLYFVSFMFYFSFFFFIYEFISFVNSWVYSSHSSYD